MANGRKVVCNSCSQFTADGKEFLLDAKSDTLEKHEFGQPGASQWIKELAARPFDTAVAAIVVKGAVAAGVSHVVAAAAHGGGERDATAAKNAASVAVAAKVARIAAILKEVAEIAAAKEASETAAVRAGYLSQHQKNVHALRVAATTAAASAGPSAAQQGIRNSLSKAMQVEFDNKKSQFVMLYSLLTHARPFVAYEQLKAPLSMILPADRMAVKH